MSMDENASSLDSSQLESRHWTITDEEGREEKVSGPGVVGMFRRSIGLLKECVSVI